MKILTMTATFGCLDGVTLSLSEGINLYALPNESGKSTWAAFVLAMFYGIDTSKRGSKGTLPEKTRYQPWNGKPMSGTLELEHNGKTIVLQRTSQRGRPMSAFRAWDKTTGLDLPELTAENCGTFFFGVEKSVFQRTAFLSGNELAVTEDQELARRLENLAVSGSMGDSYPAADARLKQWKNRCRYHQNGLIPEKEAQLLQAEGRAERLLALRQEALEADVTYEACRIKAEEVERAERECWEEKIDASQKTFLEAMERLELAEGAWTKTGPSSGALNQLRDTLLYLEKNPLPPEEACPPALQGLDCEEISDKTSRDWTVYHRLLEHEKRAGLWLWLTLGFGLLAAASAVGKIWWAMIVCLCGLVAGAILYGGVRLKKRRAEQILQSYDVENIHFIERVEKHRVDWLLAQARYRNALCRRDALVEELRAADDTITPEIATLPWVEEQLRKTEEAKQELQAAKARFLKKDTPFSPSPDLIKLRERTAYLNAQAESLRRQEEDHGGLEKALYRRDQLQQELDGLYLREQALELAREALETAHRQLEQVYAPRLTGLAGSYLQSLTQGRYDALIMGKDWQMQVREQASGLARPLASLSSGTQDQVWLSLRLAMAELLLPADAPLVLDDALLTFDGARTEAAMALFRQTGRQIILFSCKATGQARKV